MTIFDEFLGKLENLVKKEERKKKQMKKGTFIGIVALAVAAIGVLIALAAYFKNKTSYLYDEDDFLFDDPEDYDFYMMDKSEDDDLDLDNVDDLPLNTAK